MLPPSSPRRGWFYVVAAMFSVFVPLACHGMLRAYGKPVAGILLDPDCVVSNVSPPQWDGVKQGLRYPDRVLTVDGSDLQVQPGGYCASAWDAAVEAAAREGRDHVDADVSSGGQRRAIRLPVAPFDPVGWWLTGGAMLFVGCLYVLAALTALYSSPQGPLARTFAKAGGVGALMILTLLDFHSTRTLVPVFELSFALVPMAFFSLALRLPDDVPVLRSFPALVPALDVLGVGLGVAMLAQHATGGTTTGLRQVCTALLGASQVFLVVVTTGRFLLARGDRRRTLRTLLGALLVAHTPLGALALMAAVSERTSSVVAPFALPILALTPLATVVAFVRHDLWGGRTLLSRLVTQVVVAGVSGALGIGLATAFATSVGVPFQGALIGAACGGVVCAASVHVALRASDRGIFTARAQYKPTIEQLSEDLTSIQNRDQIGVAVERTVRRWLASDRVEFMMHAERGPAAVGPATGELTSELELPVNFAGLGLGVLRVGRKRGGALYTSDDIDLLRTIANQAALAIAHAESYAELERRRQQQAAAWQVERAALVETVAAEIAHEIRYPINFFRSVFARGAARHVLDAEAVEIGREEVDRLERLVAGMRRVVSQRLERQKAKVEDLAARAEVLLRDAIGQRQLEIAVPPGVTLFCDPDQITQVLTNLLSNALEASAARDRVGVSFAETPEGAELCVWDTGPGFDGDASQLFAPWFTTKPRGTGLGLAITHRLVRAHGWTVDVMRADGTTRFVVSIPASDVVDGAAPRSRPGATARGAQAPLEEAP